MSLLIVSPTTAHGSLFAGKSKHVILDTTRVVIKVVTSTSHFCSSTAYGKARIPSHCDD